MHTLRGIHLIIIKVFVLIFTSIIAVPGYAIDPNTVVGVWLFDEGKGEIVKDSSKNSHHGSVNGNPQWIDGKFGNALKFDGLDDFIDLGSDETLSLATFSVSFWFNMEVTQAWNHMVSKGTHKGAGNPGAVNWGVMSRENEAGIKYEIYEDTKWSGISSPVSLKEWHHVVATYDEDKMELYVDGTSKGTLLGAKIKIDKTRSVKIGAKSVEGPTPASYFNGSIDEVAIFNAILPVEDVKAIMNDGLQKALGMTAVAPEGKLSATWASIKEEHQSL